MGFNLPILLRRRLNKGFFGFSLVVFARDNTPLLDRFDNTIERRTV